jgi:hypothetical protein
VNKFTNEECAIKILPAEEDPSKLEFEIDFLRRMSSPYIVSFLEGYNFEGELWVSDPPLSISPPPDCHGILCRWESE